MKFTLTAQDKLSKARAGEIETDHGTMHSIGSKQLKELFSAGGGVLGADFAVRRIKLNNRTVVAPAN